MHRRRIGVLSDTHGLLRPEAVEFLRGSDLIVHAGDIGAPDVLEALRAVAPVTAVRGNNDREPWAESIAESEVLQVGEVLVYVIHDIAELDGVLYVNPGSCGPRRFKLPIAAAELIVEGGSVEAKLAELKVSSAP